MSGGFLMTVAQLEEFYKRCEKNGATTLEEKTKVLEQMAYERAVFFQSSEQIEKRFAGKKVLRIKNKKGETDERERNS